jgi:predicted Zn-dependent protease
MLPRRTIDKLVDILKKDARRTLKMHVAGFPRPYYCSFLLRDTRWFNTWASSGSTYRRRSDHTRNVYCDIRVGSYRYDQTTEGGLLDNDPDLESYSHVRVPIDDKDYAGMRIALWRLSETKFREALSDFSEKRAAGISKIDPNKKFTSFTKEEPTKHLRYSRVESIDEERWVRFCKRISRWISELPKVSGNWVEFDASQESRVFVNTEGSAIVQCRPIFSLTCVLRNLTAEGSHIEQEVVFHCSKQSELPDMRTLKKLILKKHAKLLKLIKARTIHSFSGPVLLYPLPSGLLFHEAIGHRLEGNRMLSSGEGQTFKGHTGKRVFRIDLSIRDNPKLKKFKGAGCIGAYDYDDEGVPAQDTLLVENGVLKEFLSTRSAHEKGKCRSNGHARNSKFERPISRMGVTIVDPGDTAYSLEELKEMLVEEINRQGKPFGMIVYETAGGETATTSYDFQAFAGEISYASLVFPDGKEEIVRGVDFVGTPLQALNNIIAIGSEQVLDNGYCGAESGFIPVTTISPAILLRNLELQAKDEELVTPYILPSPKLRR